MEELEAAGICCSAVVMRLRRLGLGSGLYIGLSLTARSPFEAISATSESFDAVLAPFSVDADRWVLSIVSGEAAK
jgi:hypothetical protein